MPSQRRLTAVSLLLTALSGFMGAAHASPPSEPPASALAAGFRSPPPSARPWVYWTWLSSNVTKEGITADLEAMRRVGIGGALLLDVENGTPDGPMTFFDAQWQAMFTHTVSEAKRLGLEINVNNGPGYFGSGGPWVPPEKAMQRVFAALLFSTTSAPATEVSVPELPDSRQATLRLPEMPLHDPCILADKASRTCYLYT